MTETKTKAPREKPLTKKEAAARYKAHLDELDKIVMPATAAVPVVRYLNGAYDALLGAFTSSEGMSSTSKGTKRELALRTALEHSFPPIAKVYAGDVIDSEGHQTGQLDFVVCHATAPAFGSRADEPRLMLAEGVLGIVEVKSNLRSKWSDVVGSWDKIRKIRRPSSTIGFRNGKLHVGPSTTSCAIPYFVVTKTGWAAEDELEKRLRILIEMFEGADAPMIALLQLDPPRAAVYEGWKTDQTGTRRRHTQPYVFLKKGRGLVLEKLWFPITEAARNTVFQLLDWSAYFRPLSTAPSDGAPPVAVEGSEPEEGGING